MREGCLTNKANCLTCPDQTPECMYERIQRAEAPSDETRVHDPSLPYTVMELAAWPVIKRMLHANIKTAWLVYAGCYQWNLEVRYGTDEERDWLLSIKTSCPHCGLPTHPFRMSDGPGETPETNRRNERHGGTVYWAPGCTPKENSSCAQGHAANWGYVAIKASLLYDEDDALAEVKKDLGGELTLLEHGVLLSGCRWTERARDALADVWARLGDQVTQEDVNTATKGLPKLKKKHDRGLG